MKSLYSQSNKQILKTIQRSNEVFFFSFQCWLVSLLFLPDLGLHVLTNTFSWTRNKDGWGSLFGKRGCCCFMGPLLLIVSSVCLSYLLSLRFSLSFGQSGYCYGGRSLVKPLGVLSASCGSSKVRQRFSIAASRIWTRVICLSNKLSKKQIFKLFI